VNDLIQSLFISHPPAPASGSTDPLWPVRRSFGEDDVTVPAAKAPSGRARPALRRKRVPLTA
jgi:hypothetical protein